MVLYHRDLALPINWVIINRIYLIARGINIDQHGIPTTITNR